jgi:hypothetical protein
VVSFPLAFPPIIYTRSPSPHSCYIARPSHPPRLDYSNYTWRIVTATRNYPTKMYWLLARKSKLSISKQLLVYKTIKKSPCPESANELYRLSYHRLPAKLVSTFADRGCHTDPNVRILGFYRPEMLLFLPSSSSIVLTRLSGPRSRPTTSQQIW